MRAEESTSAWCSGSGAHSMSVEGGAPPGCLALFDAIRCLQATRARETGQNGYGVESPASRQQSACTMADGQTEITEVDSLRRTHARRVHTTT